MGDMDNFDKQVEEQLQEEDFIRQCIEQLLEEEEERDTITAEELIHQKNLVNIKSVGEDKPASPAISNSHTSGRSKGYTNGYDGFSSKGYRKDTIPVSFASLYWTQSLRRESHFIFFAFFNSHLFYDGFLVIPWWSIGFLFWMFRLTENVV